MRLDTSNIVDLTEHCLQFIRLRYGYIPTGNTCQPCDKLLFTDVEKLIDKLHLYTRCKLDIDALYDEITTINAVM